ncbi:MAG: hypothetical protein ACE5E9_06985 [Nitrospinaceae bacterium]
MFPTEPYGSKELNFHFITAARIGIPWNARGRLKKFSGDSSSNATPLEEEPLKMESKDDNLTPLIRYYFPTFPDFRGIH